MDSSSQRQYIEDYFEDQRQASRQIFLGDKERERGFIPSCRTDRFDWLLQKGQAEFESNNKCLHIKQEGNTEGKWNKLIEKTEREKRSYRRSITPTIQEDSKRVLDPSLLGTPKFEGIKIFEDIKNENWLSRMLDNHENTIQQKHKQNKEKYIPNELVFPNTEGREQVEFTRLGRNEFSRRDQLSSILKDIPNNTNNGTAQQNVRSKSPQNGQLLRGLIPSEDFKKQQNKAQRNILNRMQDGHQIKSLLANDNTSVKDHSINGSRRHVNVHVQNKINDEHADIWKAQQQSLHIPSPNQNPLKDKVDTAEDKENKSFIRSTSHHNSEQQQQKLSNNCEKQSTKPPLNSIKSQSTLTQNNITNIKDYCTEFMGEGKITRNLNAAKKPKPQESNSINNNTKNQSRYQSELVQSRSKSPQSSYLNCQQYNTQQQQQNDKRNRSISCKRSVSPNVQNPQKIDNRSDNCSKSPQSTVSSKLEPSKLRNNESRDSSAPHQNNVKSDQGIKSVVNKLCYQRQQFIASKHKQDEDGKSIISVSISQRDFSKLKNEIPKNLTVNGIASHDQINRSSLTPTRKITNNIF